MVREISNMDDVIDSRDVIERIDEIHAEIEEWATGDHDPAEAEKVREELEAEQGVLRVLVAELRTVGGDEPEDGQTLVRDSYFREYAQDLADELGLIPEGYSWPTSCIDWDQAARELRMDYTSVDFDGVTYWVR